MQATRTAPPAEAVTTDWALLLPLDTQAILRVDLARIRASRHRAALATLLVPLVQSVRQDASAERITELVDRTDTLLLAMVPDERGEDDALIFVAGGVTLEELAGAAYGSEARRERIDGHDAFVGPDGACAARLAPEQLVMASSVSMLRATLARTRMRSTGARWPRPLRAAAAQADVEGATFGAIVGSIPLDEMAPGGGSIAGALGADLDDALELRASLHAPDEQTAALFAMGVEMLLGTIGSEGPALRALVDAARVRVDGSTVRVEATLDAERTQEILPALIDAVRAALAE
ncbi:MAG: hypothetical protein IT378_21335 [Sandaracinaceae bacterium]|nr:hypothetical protein [Sandaracinaceae bacterium]